MTTPKISFVGSFSKKFDLNAAPEPISLSELVTGYNYTSDYIIFLNQQNNVEWVVSRLCDHANGTLNPCSEKTMAECPLHGWRLNLETLRYNNLNVEKATLDFQIKNDNLIINQNKACLEFPGHLSQKTNTQSLSLRFLAHASLSIKCGSLTMITDPWLQGPCFMNGWWHKPCPPEDAMPQLLSADVIYISHNHADHMHTETLDVLVKQNPDIPIIIPNFKSKSTERPLKNMGFTNIITLTFNQIFEIGNEGLFVSILKSGDFRDDSGLYLNFCNKQMLITVDSSNLNQLVLPSNIDLLATSYAGGASGHPWCFDHYSNEQKINITNNRHLSVKNSTTDYIQSCKPKAYMPYAGYFEESAARDVYIKENNAKISVEDTRILVKKIDENIKFIDPTIYDEILISDTINLTSSGKSRNTQVLPESIAEYISQEHLPTNEELCRQLNVYFKNSAFTDSLVLYLVPCDDDFHNLFDGTCVDFSSNKIKIQHFANINDLYADYEIDNDNIRKLLLRIRTSRLWNTVTNMKSWEELSIGFHCRIHRKPDVYNSEFWYHFSNRYVE